MRRLLQIASIIAVCWFAEYVAKAADVPQHAVTGTEITLPSDDTVYLFGPGTAIKKEGNGEKRVTLEYAGRYTIISNGSAQSFDVAAGPTAEVAFIARPSRVPADRKDVISGTAFLFDANKNLVMAPTPVKFDLSVVGGAPQSRTVQSKDGVAYVKMDSGRKAGAAQFVASAGKSSVRRVVQQTASDPCNLRIHAEPAKDGVIVETDPVRDCAGNPVPDGTIVTITAVDAQGRSTVDARVKKGIARTQLPPMQNATLSVAAGVVVGNEIRWGGGM
jgi:hypothetical protein